MRWRFPLRSGGMLNLLCVLSLFAGTVPFSAPPLNPRCERVCPRWLLPLQEGQFLLPTHPSSFYPLPARTSRCPCSPTGRPTIPLPSSTGSAQPAPGCAGPRKPGPVPWVSPDRRFPWPRTPIRPGVLSGRSRRSLLHDRLRRGFSLHPPKRGEVGLRSPPRPCRSPQPPAPPLPSPSASSSPWWPGTMSLA